ncbi:hypothetical protein LXL04_034978 [Taraxacum kok-saghyz]
MQATSKKVITRDEWEKKLNDVKIRKEDMNKLVMNFLVTEGYVDAAEKFRMESGTEHTNPQLFFHLQQQRLIELIRNGKVEEALEFAQEELQSFLEELERTVALLAFEDVKNSPVSDLLDISQRLKPQVMSMLQFLQVKAMKKLPSLLRMLLWAQNQLDEKAAYPRITDLFTATLEDPAI